MDKKENTSDPFSKDIWKRFINRQETPEDIAQLRPVIYQSWLRCREANVDPYIENFTYVSDADLKKRLSDNRLLLSIARSYMDNLSSFLEGEHHTVVIVDADDILLYVTGGTGAEMEEDKSRTRIKPGSIRLESCTGTTASSLCMIEDMPVMLRGTENYIEAHQNFSGAGVPIHYNGRIIGSLGIVGYLPSHSFHTLGMLVAAVDGIEKEFRLRSAYKQLQISNSQLKSTFQSVSSGMLILNNSGQITQTNDKACRLLSCSEKDLVGNIFSDLYRIEELEKPVHLIEKNLFNREVTITSASGQAVSALLSANVITNASGTRYGTVLALDTPRQVKRLVSRMSGFTARYTLDSIIGNSPSLTAAKELCRAASNVDSSILITGESGTGKELFAQAIHNASSRAKYPFIAINCASLPADLVESELFGYVGGAFTGASKEGQPGKFELADNGTLFLDEIGDMPFGIQSTLLRVLQMKEIVRIGGKNTIPVNVRIIAATNKNLPAEIEANRFRQDLYYRLNVFPLQLPPLRNRHGDIAVLAGHFIEKYTGKPFDASAIAPDALHVLEHYHWPGNIRELQNVIERAAILSQGGTILCSHLPAELLAPKPAADKAALFHSRTDGLPARSLPQGSDPDAVQPDPLFNEALPVSRTREQPFSAYRNQIAELERERILSALKETHGNIAQTARILGVSRQTLYYKLRQNQLNPEDFRLKY